jgi:hypothetical protein
MVSGNSSIRKDAVGMGVNAADDFADSLQPQSPFEETLSSRGKE